MGMITLVLCVHIHWGMIAPMCAFTRGHDQAYVLIYVRIAHGLEGNANTKSKQDKTKCDELERHDSVYAMSVQACLRDTVPVLFLCTNVENQAWVFPATIRQSLKNAMF